MKRSNTFFSKLYLVIAFLIMYLPILYLVVYSFNSGGTMNSFEGFTLEHYRSVFEDTRLWVLALNTFIMALLSALIATIVGTFGAISIYYMKKRRNRELTLNLNNVLMVSPDVMIGASFLILFTKFLPVKLGFWSVLLSHISFNIPIVVLMVLPRLYEMNDSMVTAGVDLGASTWQIVSRIIIPNIQAGILSGFFMAFTYSLDDFAVTHFVTGGGFSTLSIEIYSRARQGVSLEINALSTILLLVAFGLVLGYYFLEVNRIKKSRQKEQVTFGE